MKRYRSNVIPVILFSFLLSFSLLANAAEAQQAAIDSSKSEEVTQKDLEEAAIKEAKENAAAAKTVAAAVKREAEVNERALEIERKKAEIELKEAEAARKEAQIIKDAAGSKDEINRALEKVEREEKEAQLAQQKIEVSEERVRAAREKAEIIEEELALVREREAIAEAKIRQKHAVIYGKLIQTGTVVFVGYLLILLLIPVVNRRVEDVKSRHFIRKNIIYIVNIAIIIISVFIWVRDIGSVTILFSALGAGLILVLHEPILCMAGWFYILLHRPFEVGDRVEFGGAKGDVMDIRLFQTSLMEIGSGDQSTGRMANIPNSEVFKKENYNYSRGFEFVWNELKILVTFESDYKRAEEIMMKHAAKEAAGMETVVKGKLQAMAKHYMVHYDKLVPKVYTDIKDSGVELSLRYLTEAKERRGAQDDLCRAILDDFAKEENVNFAYATYRIVK